MGKTCSACRQEKVETDFYPDISKKDGLTSRCRECQKRAAGESHRRNREKRLQAMRIYAVTNRERITAQKNAWLRRNPKKRAEKEARRRAQRRRNGVERIDVTAVYLRDKGRCHICGGHVTFEEMSLDHVVPLVRGGGHLFENVRVSHLVCNIRKGAS